MANSEPAKATTDAVTNMVQKARLPTTSSNQCLSVRHSIRNDLAQGSSLQEYWENREYIGCGGFGSIYSQECTHVQVLWDESDKQDEDNGAKCKIGSLRAVKQIAKPRDQIKLSEEFLSELHGLVSLTESKYEYHFVQTYGWYESERTLFIAMEYMPLGDLEAHLVNKGVFKEADAKFISEQVLRGLESMHKEDVVHRNLKPSNLLIKQMPPNRPWWIKISDFGLSKKLERSRGLSSTVCGTLGFMAPELLGFSTPGNQLSQLSQLDKWKAADIWAFGETMYRLLTGASSFGGNMQDLHEYCQNETKFPRETLERNEVPADGIELIRRCMAPCPADRPSATAILSQLRWPMTHCKNGYENITTDTTYGVECWGEQPPFILFSPDGEHLIAVDAGGVLVWNVESQADVGSHVAKNNAHFYHASIHPRGSFLCVTQTKRRKPLILHDAIHLKYDFRVDDNLDGGGNHPTISTFSPDGKTLVTARNDLFCQIEIDNDWLAMSRNCVAAEPSRNRNKCENRIEDLRFTKDGSELIVACHTQVVIMNTKTSFWSKKQVIEYPCKVNDLDISLSGTMVACGSTTGELWLWISDMGCWVRRIKPDGSPGAKSSPVENVRFSANGQEILYNYHGRCGVNMCRSVPLDEVCFAHNLRNHKHPWRRMGHTITYPSSSSRGIGATALGGHRGAEIVFWKYEL